MQRRGSPGAQRQVQRLDDNENRSTLVKKMFYKENEGGLKRPTQLQQQSN